MLTWAQIAIGILYSGIAHEQQPNFRHRKKNKTPAEAFTPPADEKKMGTIWIQRRCGDYTGMQRGLGRLITYY